MMNKTIKVNYCTLTQNPKNSTVELEVEDEEEDLTRGEEDEAVVGITRSNNNGMHTDKPISVMDNVTHPISRVSSATNLVITQTTVPISYSSFKRRQKEKNKTPKEQMN